MDNVLSEQMVLSQLNISDFRHITKDKVMAFASMLQNMEPEVAKKAIGQFPEFAKMSLEVLKDYKEVMENTLDKNAESSKQCYAIYDGVASALQGCLNVDDLPFEEKKYYIDKMMEVAKMAERKDTENKDFNWKVIRLGAVAVVAIVGIGASVLGGNTSIKVPEPPKI